MKTNPVREGGGDGSSQGRLPGGSDIVTAET